MSRLFAHLGIYYAHKPLNGGGVVVREEFAFALVERGNFRHILGRECEVEHVEIFFHSFAADRFGYYNHPALNEKAESGLGHRLAVLFAHGLNHGIVEEVAPALGKGTPALVGDAVLLHYGVCRLLLLEHVRFNLVYGWLYVAEVENVYQSVGVEV